MRRVGGPFFEDFTVGQVFDTAPAVTITEGLTAFHQALTGDRLRLALDVVLCEAVTGSARLLVNPGLVTNVAIGQTTEPSQRVRANLFYRQLVLRRPVFVGDTLRTVTTVVGLKQNRRQPNKPATGLVALEMHTVNQRGETVLHFWRCPMIPLRDPEVDTGHADRFDAIPDELDLETLAAAVPVWDLVRYHRDVPRPHAEDLVAGAGWQIEDGDVVTGAPELARLTLNLAAGHHDATASPYGRRLVYGGHTIAVAGAHVAKALPGMVTVLAWRSCDHLAPVFEGDLLRSDVEVTAVTPAPGGGADLVELEVRTYARHPDPARLDQAPTGAEEQVLAWRPVVLV